MKKIFIALLLILSFSLKLRSNFDTDGSPVIFHYQKKKDFSDFFVMAPALKEISPSNLINVAPNLLIERMLDHLNIKYLNPKLTFLKLVEEEKTIKFIFDIAIWAKIEGKWPKDREYNVAFHEFAKNWDLKENAEKRKNKKGEEIISTKKDFLMKVDIGLFDPNGIDPLLEPVKPKGKGYKISGRSISFNNFSNKPVYYHPFGKIIQAYSPDNNAFRLKNNREIASFWTSAISPDKKNVIVVFNILVDNEDLNNLIKIQLNFNTVLEILNNNFGILKNKEDQIALEKAIKTIKKASIKPNYFTSIFKPEGFRKYVTNFEGAMEQATALKGTKEFQEVLKKAEESLFYLKSNSDVLLISTPLRNYLAKHNFITDDPKIILDKQKSLESFEKSIQERENFLKTL